MLQGLIIRGVAGSLTALVLVSGGATVMAGNGHATTAMATCADGSTPATVTATRSTAGMMRGVGYAVRTSPSTPSQGHQAMSGCATGSAAGANGR